MKDDELRGLMEMLGAQIQIFFTDGSSSFLDENVEYKAQRAVTTNHATLYAHDKSIRTWHISYNLAAGDTLHWKTLKDEIYRMIERGDFLAVGR